MEDQIEHKDLMLDSAIVREATLICAMGRERRKNILVTGYSCQKCQKEVILRGVKSDLDKHNERKYLCESCVPLPFYKRWFGFLLR